MRINKLDDISFIEKLTNLEVIKLQDLKHISSLPDLSRHKELKLLFLIDTGIQIDDLPDDIQAMVSQSKGIAAQVGENGLSIPAAIALFLQDAPCEGRLVPWWRGQRAFRKASEYQLKGN